MSGMFEEMKKHEGRNKIVINRKGNEMYEIFGYKRKDELIFAALENRKLGSLLSIATVLAESDITTTIHLMTILGALYHISEEQLCRAGDLLELLNSKLDEEEMVKVANMMIMTHQLKDRK